MKHLNQHSPEHTKDAATLPVNIQLYEVIAHIISEDNFPVTEKAKSFSFLEFEFVSPDEFYSELISPPPQQFS